MKRIVSLEDYVEQEDDESDFFLTSLENLMVILNMSILKTEDVSAAVTG